MWVKFQRNQKRHAIVARGLSMLGFWPLRAPQILGAKRPFLWEVLDARIPFRNM